MCECLLWEELKTKITTLLEEATDELKNEKTAVNKAMADWRQALEEHTTQPPHGDTSQQRSHRN